MKKFTLISLALVLLNACADPTPQEPPTVQLEVTTNSKVQNVLNVSVTVTGDNVNSAVLTRQEVVNGVNVTTELKNLKTGPFSFTLDDTVPGNGVYTYKVKASNGAYTTETQRQVTYTYTVKEP